MSSSQGSRRDFIGVDILEAWNSTMQESIEKWGRRRSDRDGGVGDAGVGAVASGREAAAERRCVRGDALAVRGLQGPALLGPLLL